MLIKLACGAQVPFTINLFTWLIVPHIGFEIRMISLV